MSADLQRARILRQHRRHEEAVALLRQYLGSEPEDAEAYLELALNHLEMPGQRKQALEDVRAAVALEPDHPVHLALQAQVLSALDREKEALPVADAALALDPGFAFAWVAKAQALGGLSRWKEAEEAARAALRLEPDDETASNLLAHFLRMQNRLEESEAESQRRLARDPENAFSFANAGWAALQRHQPGEAEKLFLEALRLDPEFEHARLGLREAYKARSLLYRLYLRWIFFMQRHTAANRFLIIIGIYLVFRFGRGLLAAIHPLAAVPLVVAYLLFAFGSWLAGGLGHFLLLKDPKARQSLNRGEKRDGLAVGGLFFGGLLLLLLGAFRLLPLGFAILGGTMMGAAIPAGMVFTNPSKAGRVLFGAVALGVVGCGVAILLQSFGLAPGSSGGLLLAAGVAVMGTTFAGLAPGLRRGTAE